MADESPVAAAATGSELLFQPPPAVAATAPLLFQPPPAVDADLIIQPQAPVSIEQAEATPAEAVPEPAEVVPQTVEAPAAEPVAQPAVAPQVPSLFAAPAEAAVPAEPEAPVEAPAPVETPEEALSRKASAALKRIQELLPGVTDGFVLEQLAELSDSAALEKFLKDGAKKPEVKAQKRWSVKDMAAAAGSGAPVNNSQAAPSPQASWSQRKSLNSGGAPVSSFVPSQPKSAFVGTEGQAKAHASQEVAKSLTKGLGLVNVMGGHGAGQGGGLGLNRPGSGPKVSHFAGKAGGGARSITVHPDASVAWQEMLDDKSPTSWVIATYSSDTKTLNLAQKGEGGLQSFKDSLPQDMAWGGFKCNAVDKRGGLECKRMKFVFICYKPQSVSQIRKAKQASHKGDVKEAFPNAHLDVVVEGLDDLDEQSLIVRLQAATGAHKPNGYEFEEGQFVEADFYGLGIGKDCRGENAKGNA